MSGGPAEVSRVTRQFLGEGYFSAWFCWVRRVFGANACAACVVCVSCAALQCCAVHRGVRSLFLAVKSLSVCAPNARIGHNTCISVFAEVTDILNARLAGGDVNWGPEAALQD